MNFRMKGWDLTYTDGPGTDVSISQSKDLDSSKKYSRSIELDCGAAVLNNHTLEIERQKKIDFN